MSSSKNTHRALGEKAAEVIANATVVTADEARAMGMAESDVQDLGAAVSHGKTAARQAKSKSRTAPEPISTNLGAQLEASVEVAKAAKRRSSRAFGFGEGTKGLDKAMRKAVKKEAASARNAAARAKIAAEMAAADASNEAASSLPEGSALHAWSEPGKIEEAMSRALKVEKKTKRTEKAPKAPSERGQARAERKERHLKACEKAVRALNRAVGGDIKYTLESDGRASCLVFGSKVVSPAMRLGKLATWLDGYLAARLRPRPATTAVTEKA